MGFNKIRNISYFISFALHLILAFFFYLVSFQIEPDESEFVLLGFGTFGKNSKPSLISKENKKNEKPKDNKKKNVKVPKAKNTEENDVTPVMEKEKENPEKKKKKEKEEILGGEEGNYGFAIDFGGKGRRKIYSYTLPAYPEGVSKEIDVKLRFTILPDGSVTNIFPLIKADARLEMAAINSLRQWRFEPLPSAQKQIAQNAIIVFPYRLR